MDDQITRNIFVAIFFTAILLIFLYVILWKRRDVALFILEALTMIVFSVALIATAFVMFLILRCLLIMNAAQQYFFFPDEWYVLFFASIAGGLISCIKNLNLGIGWLVAMGAAFITIVVLIVDNGLSISPEIFPSIIFVSFIAGSGAAVVIRPFALVHAQTSTDNSSSLEDGQEE